MRAHEIFHQIKSISYLKANAAQVLDFFKIISNRRTKRHAKPIA